MNLRDLSIALFASSLISTLALNLATLITSANVTPCGFKTTELDPFAMLPHLIY